MNNLTQETLKQLFTYDPNTGLFKRLNPKGRQSNCLPNSNGYVTIMIDGKRYYAHRLAFLYMTGEWPAMQVDHIDGNRANNCWDNLRDVSPSVNQNNPSTKPVLPYRGVYYNKPRAKWYVIHAKKYHGSYDTEHAAQEAYNTLLNNEAIK